MEKEAHTLIDDLLAEQQELTAVELFSRAHDEHAVRGQRYRDLLPLTPPVSGQQYAFEVDLDKCSGCKACVSACHSLNGLDDDETWRGVGLLVGDPAEDVRARRGAAAFQQNVTTACHHCVDPACLNGCPVLAYDKDAVTGIVKHLDDQCIGCQYCVMMCPYEVPQYSKARGIVRKCDMCSSRLAVGEAPACAQACPTNAIKITVVDQQKVRGKYRGLPELNLTGRGEREKRRKGESSSAPYPLFPPANPFLPASPNPAITLPTTRFVTQRTLPENLFAGDDSALRRSDSHLPLVILLVLSQMAIGASIAANFVSAARPLLLTALAVGVVAMVAGSQHLGQPLKAWRSFLGWRKSWFSREVIALGAFVFLVALAVSVTWLPAIASLERFLAPLAAFAGVLTVTCSAMIYVDTRRDFWSAPRSFTKFFGTTLLLGTVTTLLVTTTSDPLGVRGQAQRDPAFAGSIGEVPRPPASESAVAAGALPAQSTIALALALVFITLAKLAFERRIFLHLVDGETPAQTPLNKTARLLADDLNAFVRSRIVFGIVGGVLLPLIAVGQATTNPASVPALVAVALGFCIAGEMLERYLFFTAVVSRKMPGSLAS